MKKDKFITPGKGVSLTLLEKYGHIMDEETKLQLISEIPEELRAKYLKDIPKKKGVNK